MADTPTNLILLSVDALRADHLSSYGYERTTTPFLDELGDANVRFTDAYSPSSHTRESVPALLSGQYPDVFSDAGFQLVETSIAETVSAGGFQTGAFHSNPFISRAYGFGEGFDTFDDDLYLSSNKLVALAQRAFDKLRNRHYATAEEINERSLEWLDGLASDEPFFLWNHYMDPHGPYQPPESHISLFSDTASSHDGQELYKRATSGESLSVAERQAQIDRYDAEIRYLDDQLSSLFDALRSRGVLSDALIVITADHGDGFGGRGYHGHPRYVDDKLIEVPLFVVGDHVPSATIDTPASGLDVVPTFLEAIDSDVRGYPGIPLQRLWNDPAAFEDRCVFAQTRGEREETHLHRFAGRTRYAACSATVNLREERIELDDDPACTDALAERLRRHCRERMGDTVEIKDERVADDAVNDRLEALGYRE